MFQKYTKILTQVFVVIFLSTNIVNSAPKKSPEAVCYENIVSVFNDKAYEEDEKFRNESTLMLGATANYYMRLAFLKFTTEIVKNTRNSYALAYYNFLGKSIEKAVCSSGKKGTLKDPKDYVDSSTFEEIYGNSLDTGCWNIAASSSKKLTTKDIIKNAYFNVAFTSRQIGPCYVQKSSTFLYWDLYHYHVNIVEFCYEIVKLPTPEEYCEESCRENNNCLLLP